MEYEILKVYDEGEDSFVGKVKLSSTGEEGVIKKGKKKEILIEEGRILRSLPKGIGPKWLGEWEEGIYYCLFMEYVEGQTLEEYMETKGGILSLRECVELMEYLIGEVRKLHEQETPILYRDLKPSNIICCNNGSVKLVDFGGAILLKGQEKKWRVGSPFFAAPEQFLKGGKETKSTDVYALGAVFYYLLIGNRTDQMSGFPRKIGRTWKEIIEKCMEWDPSQRYPDTRVLLYDIKRAFYEQKGHKLPIFLNHKNRKLKWEKNIEIYADVT